MADDNEYLWEIGKRIQDRYPGIYDRYSKHDIGIAARKNNPQLFEDFKKAVDYSKSPPNQPLSDYFGSLWQTINPMPMARLGGRLAYATAKEAVGRGDEKYNETLRHELFQSFVQPQIDQYKQAREEWNRGERVSGAGHALAAALPGYGPIAAQAGEQFGRGDIAGGAGTVTGLLVPMGAGKAFRAVERTINPAESLYRSSLSFPSEEAKPSIEGMREVSERGLGRPVPAASPPRRAMPVAEKSLRRILKREEVTKKKVTAEVKTASRANAAIPVKDIVAQAEEEARKAEHSVSPGDAAIIRKSIREFQNSVGNATHVSADIAQEWKENTDNSLSRRVFGETAEPSGKTATKKDLRTGLQKGIEKVAPNVHDLNKAIHLDIQLREAINESIKTRPSFWKSSTPWIMGTAAMAVRDLLRSGHPGWAGTAATGAIVRAAFMHPQIMSRLAIFLERSGQMTDKLSRGINAYTAMAALNRPPSAAPEESPGFNLDDFLK